MVLALTLAHCASQHISQTKLTTLCQLNVIFAQERIMNFNVFTISSKKYILKLHTFCKVLLKFKGALDKFNIISQLFPKKVGIFIPLEVMAWVMTACRVLCSRLTYF